MLSLILAFGISISFMISMLVFGAAGTRELGVGIGQFLFAIVASVMAAIYF